MLAFVDCLTPEEWKPLSENAHLVVFGTSKSAALERIDFALIAKTEKQMLGYVTCREVDAETVRWQYGGSFPGTKGTVLSTQAMEALLLWCSAHYKRLGFMVENTNYAMLKMAIRYGFRIIGARAYDGSVMLEHVVEFEK